MNRQALIFGIGGMMLAGALALFIVKPGDKAEQNVLSETDSVPTRDVSNPQDNGTMDQLQETADKDTSMNQKQPPDMQIDLTKTYTAVLTTAGGDITIQLFADKAPITVNNFVALSRENFYAGTIFHRVIDGFMIQGGDPEGTGAGGPGYQFNDEPFDGEYTRGTVAMANAGPNTNGPQLFIMHKDYPLPKNYVIFGKVSSGIDVLDKIATAEVTDSGLGEKSKPVNPVKIHSIEIIEE